MTDARERRRQRAQQAKGASSAALFKRYRVPLVIVLVAGAIITYNVVAAQRAEDCPGHWHSTFDLYVDGQHVAFTPNPQYTNEGGMPLRTHMHRGSEGIWHFEPAREDCIAFSEALDRLDVTLSAGRVVLEGGYHESAGWGGTHEVDENNTLRITMKEWQGEWKNVSASQLNRMQIPDGASVLVVFGDENDTAIEQLQQSGTTQLPGNLRPASGGPSLPWGAIAGTLIFTFVALVIWYNFAKQTW